MPFEEVCEDTGKVQQEFSRADLYNPLIVPQIANLGNKVSEYVNSILPPYQKWQWNDVAIQRYKPEDTGITWHRDYSRDKLLVAVVSLKGGARFDIAGPEMPGEDDDITELRLSPGDLVLLRAPGLTGQGDDRLHHQVHSPETGERISIGFRQNERLEGKNGNH